MLAPSTVKVLHGVVASIFKAAIKDRVVQASPCDGTRLPKVDPRRVEPLTTGQVEALITAVPPRFRALILLGAGTGGRQGEAFGLSLDRVDFLRRTLRVDGQLQLVQNGAPYLAPPKTAKSHRTIPLPQIVLDALAAHLAEFPATPVPIRIGTPSGSVEEVCLLFTDARGRPLRRANFSAAVWRPAARAAGLEPGIGFHAPRHYYASLLIRSRRVREDR